jgi:hypothetical protein
MGLPMTTSILKNLILLLLATSLIASCNQSKSDSENQEAETPTSLSIQDIQLANGSAEDSVKTDVPVNTDIIVTFKHAVDPNEIHTNTADHNCAGEIQVSAVDFSACVVMLSNPVPQNGNRSFVVQPANELEYDTTYKIKVAKVLNNEKAGYRIYEFTTLSNDTTSDAKDITAFSFLSNNNAALTEDVIATISGSSIDAVVPFGTDVTALKATFSTFGSTVEVNTVLQNRGITANDFSSALTYTVTAVDGSTKDYTVTVNIAAIDAKDLTAFSFLFSNNAPLTDTTATISGTSIDATVPFGTDITALKATFSTSGSTVKVGADVQSSGVTANDFSSDVIYTVTAADGSTKDYTVTVNIAASDEKNLTAFSFLFSNNAPLTDTTATISGTSIYATVPSGTDVTALVATFSTSGSTVDVSAVVQSSGVTPNDFSNELTYTVTAADTSTKDYTVTVYIAANEAKDLTAFSFMSNNNAALAEDVMATISGTSIDATVPIGTDVTALVATFSTSGSTVDVGAVVQSSGITANDFSSAVTYTVTAGDATTKNYTVTVNIPASDSKDLIAFSFMSSNNAALAEDVTATISGTDIDAVVPFGTDVTALVASFTTSGSTVEVSAVEQTSDVTDNDFSIAVTYTVTAADLSTKDYTVTVTEAVASAKSIDSFSFLAVDNPSELAEDVHATISGTDISVTVPNVTDLSKKLRVTFTFTGNEVQVDGGTVISGDRRYYDSAVIFTVIAGDNSTINYTVTVINAP